MNKLSIGKRTQIVGQLVEGSSMRAPARLADAIVRREMAQSMILRLQEAPENTLRGL